MKTVVECVANVSEGRRLDVVHELVDGILDVSGASLADWSSDRSHNRSVFTILGEPEALGEAVERLYQTAIDRIDLNTHRGVHPRIGAVDVLPFVPLRDATMQSCVHLARDVSKRLAAQFEVPVYLYGEAATCPERRALEHVRGSGLADLSARMSRREWVPDFGPPRPHPTAGATAVGARQVLIAFNVNLHSTDVSVARQVARAVRARDGGLAAVKALGLRLEARGLVQVSMNLVDYTTTPLRVVFERVSEEAGRHGVQVAESEVIGLLPANALVGTSPDELRLRRFGPNRIIENHLD